MSNFGLGDFLAQAAEGFDVSLPVAVIDQFNDKASFNDNDQLVFNFPEFSGVLGAEEGELKWNQSNGNAVYKYNVIFNDDDGLEGSFSHNFSGPLIPFWQDVLELDNWEHATEDYSCYWSINPVDMKALFGYGANQVVKASGLQHNFHYGGSVQIEVEASDSSFELKINPTSQVDGWDTAPAAFGSYWFGPGDYNYESTIVLSVPEFDACDDYFNNFNAASECVVTFESSDLGNEPVLLKLKHKFGFVKFENNMAYVKSENYDGNMVSFEEVPYLSFYFTDKAAGQPFLNIRQKYYNVQDDLWLTVPVMAIEDVLEAVDEFLQKFEDVFDYAFNNPVESAYWVDTLFGSVKPSTFDFSGIVAESRFAIIDFSNAEFTKEAKGIAQDIYQAVKDVEFDWLQEFRDYVVQIQEAESDVAKNLVFPQ